MLALLTAFFADDGHAWKGYDFEVMNRLHESGFIDNPVNKNKGVHLTANGIQRGKELAAHLFGWSSAADS